MMAAKDVKMSTDNLSCPVCYDLFKKPKYLPCHHSYCELCLEKIQVDSKIVCPECRKEAVIPPGGVKDFDDNFFVNRLVDEFILKRKVEGEEEVKCDDCQGEDPVVAFCPDCTMFLCHVCNEHHKRSIKSRDHGIVPLIELRSKKDVLIQQKQKAMMCREHDIELLFYCETCDQLVCMYCTVKGHNGHNHDTVKNVADKHRQELETITVPVEKMIKDLSNTHDNIEKTGSEIKQQGDEVNQKINQHYDSALQKLTEEKKKWNQEVNATISKKEEAVMQQLSKVEHVQAEVMRMKKLKDDMKKSSDQEVLSVKKEVIDRMKQINDKYKKINFPPVQQATLKFVPTKGSILPYGTLYSVGKPDPHKPVVNSPKKPKKAAHAVTTQSGVKSASTTGVTSTASVQIGAKSKTMRFTAAHTAVSSINGALCSTMATASRPAVSSIIGRQYNLTRQPLDKPITGTHPAVATPTDANKMTPLGSGQRLIVRNNTVPIPGAQSPGPAKVILDYLTAQVDGHGPGVTSKATSTTQAKPTLASNIAGAASPITDSKSGRKRKYPCEMCEGCKAPKCLSCKFCLDPALKKPCIIKICKQPQE